MTAAAAVRAATALVKSSGDGTTPVGSRSLLCDEGGFMRAGRSALILAAVAGAALMTWLATRNRVAQHTVSADRRRPWRRGEERARASSSDSGWSDTRVTHHAPREWLSDYRRGPDGRVGDNALIDGAVEDTFPASDPPAFMQAVILGPPPHKPRNPSGNDRDERVPTSPEMRR
jgi:hypothetical protein